MTRLLFCLLACFMLAACQTNTRLDALFFESEYLYVPIDSNSTREVCLALEAEGYQFDIFEINQSIQRVQYPDGTHNDFVESDLSIDARVITGIERNFDEAIEITDEELTRLKAEANQTCVDIELVAENALEAEVRTNFSLYDWVSGTVILYQGMCGELQTSSVSFGSYGNTEQFEQSICTSDLYSLSSGN